MELRGNFEGERFRGIKFYWHEGNDYTLFRQFFNMQSEVLSRVVLHYKECSKIVIC